MEYWKIWLGGGKSPCITCSVFVDASSVTSFFHLAIVKATTESKIVAPSFFPLPTAHSNPTL